MKSLPYSTEEELPITLQMPPVNIEIEEAILGGLLLDREAIFRVRDSLSPEKFYVHQHQLICRAILALADASVPVDMMTVASWLNDHHLLEKAGGQPKIVMLVERTVSSLNIDAYCLLLQDKYIRRELIQTGHKLIQLGHATEIPLPEVKEESQKALFKTLDKEIGEKFAPEMISDCLGRVFSQLESGVSPGFNTGLLDLDNLTQFKFTELIIVAGRTGMGKTWFGCHLAIYLARTYNFPVVFFTAEMSKDELGVRLLSLVSGVDSDRLNRRQINDLELEKIASAMAILSGLKIIIDDTPASQLTPGRMRAVLRKTQAQYGMVGAVFLDYLQKLGDLGSPNRVSELGAIVVDCKNIAKEFNTMFFALAQFNRKTEERNDKRPNISDLANCGWIENEANLILSLYREDYYNPNTEEKNICEVGVLKNRSGKTGTIKTLFKPELGGYQNLVQRNGY